LRGGETAEASAEGEVEAVMFSSMQARCFRGELSLTFALLSCGLAWLFPDELEARIASAEERAALYADEDPDNDPPTWMAERKLCVGCHASKH
jgi:hypothetical protein